MKFYDRYYKNSFEELMTYYPRYYREVFEMVEILKAEGWIADSLEAGVEQTYLNGFIDYMDEASVVQWETFLGEPVIKSRTLDERRRIIKSYILGFGKCSASILEAIIRAYTGTTADIDIVLEQIDDARNHGLIITCGDIGGSLQNQVILHHILSRKVPAHLWYFIREVREVSGEFYAGAAVSGVSMPPPVFESKSYELDSEITAYIGTVQIGIAEPPPVFEELKYTAEQAKSTAVAGTTAAQVILAAPVVEDMNYTAVPAMETTKTGTTAIRLIMPEPITEIQNE